MKNNLSKLLISGICVLFLLSVISVAGERYPFIDGCEPSYYLGPGTIIETDVNYILEDGSTAPVITVQLISISDSGNSVEITIDGEPTTVTKSTPASINSIEIIPNDIYIADDPENSGFGLSIKYNGQQIYRCDQNHKQGYFKIDDSSSIVGVPVREGWNLVPLYMGGANSEDSDISSEDLSVMWAYDIENKIFIKSGTPEADELNDRIYGNSEIKEYYRGSGAWVYTRKSGTLVWKISPETVYSKFTNMKLIQGWNIIQVVPDMNGMSLPEITGECKVEKVAVWNADEQDWGILITPNDENYANNEFNLKYVGMILLIKVEDQCTLGTTAPPNLPDTNVPGLPE